MKCILIKKTHIPCRERDTHELGPKMDSPVLNLSSSPGGRTLQNSFMFPVAGKAWLANWILDQRHTRFSSQAQNGRLPSWEAFFNTFKVEVGESLRISVRAPGGTLKPLGRDVLLVFCCYCLPLWLVSWESVTWRGKRNEGMVTSLYIFL